MDHIHDWGVAPEEETVVPANLVSRAPDLAKLAQQENLVYVVLPKVIADSFRGWSGSVQIRVEDDTRHPRLRKLVIRPANGGGGGQQRSDRPANRRRRRRPPRPEAAPSA